jgi:hypothetical protein
MAGDGGTELLRAEGEGLPLLVGLGEVGKQVFVEA